MESLDLELPTASENILHYELYTDSNDVSPEDLDALRVRCVAALAQHLAGYPWQLERFELRSSHQAPPPSHSAADKRGAPPCLWGTLRFGDAVDDEWFATWLLRELTRCIPGTTARVWDNDGEFLLIEAAYHLPRWLKPETAGNRVWLRGGAVHLVPLPSAAHPDLPSLPSTAQALQVLQGGRVPTLASAEMRTALEARLGAYPAQARLNRHTARATLPAAAAAVLAAEPALAAPAVAAFYARDVQDMAAAARQRRFPPEAMVTVAVPLSRCSYAQLAQQPFEPPRARALPPPGHPAHKPALLGAKLTAGLEMLYWRGANLNIKPGRPDGAAAGAREPGEPRAAVRDAVPAAAESMPGPRASGAPQEEGDPEWAAFLAALQRSGFFAGAEQGSARGGELRAQALAGFREERAARRAAAARADPARRVDEVLSAPPDPERLEREMAGAEDDDAWMTTGADELDAELAAREAEQGAPPGGTGPTGRAAPAFDPEQMAERVKAFLGGESGPEGAEVPRGARAVPNPKGSAQRDAGISFNAAGFWAELGSTLGLPPGMAAGFEGEGSDSDEGSSFFSEGSAGSQMGGGLGADLEDNAFGGGDVSDYGFLAEARGRRASALLEPGTARSSERVASTRGSGPLPQGASAGRPGPRRAGDGAPALQGSRPEAGGAAGSGAAAADERWETATATDSDDGEAASAHDFNEAYGAALAEQLAGTRVGATFMQTPDPNPACGSTAGGAAGLGAAPGAHGGTRGDPGVPGGVGGGDLQPVDVDVNLVQSLLASYAGQQGLPGPAGALAGLLGIQLPDDADA